MKKLQSIGFNVYAGSGSLNQINLHIKKSNYSSVHLICDDNTFAYCLPFFLENCKEIKSPYIIQLPGGEKNKNLKSAQLIWKSLIKQGANRKSLVINLGGGVITDMGAFAASTFMRGIDFIQVPTTLLAMVDASVGGKTGVDLGKLKNMIGTFTPPVMVCIDLGFLKSLPEKEIKSGYAEVIKHALIADHKQFERLKKISSSKIVIKDDELFLSVAIKNKIVKKDFKEVAERKLLNFGHTIGHAIEGYLLDTKSSLLHGEAIFIGMMCENYIAFKKGILHKKEFTKVESYLKTLIVKNAFQEKDFSKILSLTKFDKKNTNKQVNFTLLTSIGKGLINQTASAEEMHESLKYYISL